MTVSCSSFMDFHLNRQVEEVYKLAFPHSFYVKSYLRWCVHHQNSCSKWIIHTSFQILVTDKDWTTIAKTLRMSYNKREHFVSTMQCGNARQEKNLNYAFLVYSVKIIYGLLTFDYRSNKSLVTHKVYEKNETRSQGSRLLQQNQRIKRRLQIENNWSFSQVLNLTTP